MLPKLPTDNIFLREIKSNAKHLFTVLPSQAYNFIHGKQFRNIFTQVPYCTDFFLRLNMSKNIKIKLLLSA